MTALLDKVADLAIAPLTNTPLLSTATTFELLDLAGDISRFPDPLTQGYYAWVWNRDSSTGFPNVGDADRNGQAERVRVVARDVGLGTLTVVRGASPINLNVAGGDYWLVGAMNAQIIEDIDDRLWDISGAVLTTGKDVTAPKLTLTTQLDLVAAAGVAPINLFEDPGNGTSKVQLTAPPSLTGDIPIQFLDTLPSGVEFLTISPTGVMATSPATTAISLDDAYNEGRIIIADVGAVEIQGAGGLQITHTQPVLLFETTNTGPSTFNWRFIASSVNSFHLQRGDQDEDIDDDTFLNAFRYDGDTRRLGLNLAPAPSDLLHLFNPITGPTRIRLQPLDNLNASDVGILIVNSAGVSVWEFGHDISAGAFIFGRSTFTAPELGIGNTDGRVSIHRVPGAAATLFVNARLDVFNDSGSPLVGVFIDQDADEDALLISSGAADKPLIHLLANNTNFRGDIQFTGRANEPASPHVGDIWFNSVQKRWKVQSIQDGAGGQSLWSPFGCGAMSIIGESSTIASGTLTLPGNGNRVTAVAEGGPGADSITTITAAVVQFAGDLVLITPGAGDTITIVHDGVNIILDGSTNKLLNLGDHIIMMRGVNNSHWRQWTPVMNMVV